MTRYYTLFIVSVVGYYTLFIVSVVGYYTLFIVSVVDCSSLCALNARSIFITPNIGVVGY
jgi:hypothetical protein